MSNFEEMKIAIDWGFLPSKKDVYTVYRIKKHFLFLPNEQSPYDVFSNEELKNYCLLTEDDKYRWNGEAMVNLKYTLTFKSLSLFGRIDFELAFIKFSQLIQTEIFEKSLITCYDIDTLKPPIPGKITYVEYLGMSGNYQN